MSKLKEEILLEKEVNEELDFLYQEYLYSKEEEKCPVDEYINFLNKLTEEDDTDLGYPTDKELEELKKQGF